MLQRSSARTPLRILHDTGMTLVPDPHAVGGRGEFLFDAADETIGPANYSGSHTRIVEAHPISPSNRLGVRSRSATAGNDAHSSPSVRIAACHRLSSAGRTMRSNVYADSP